MDAKALMRRPWWSFITLSLISIASTVAVSGCSTWKPFDPALKDQDRFLCCNLRFNKTGDATDANYQAPFILPVGTTVRVTEVGSQHIRLAALGDPKQYYLELRFGLPRISASEYFNNVLLTTDPKPELARSSAEVRTAIERAVLIPGMTKQEALMARGYPPAHHTYPNDNLWIYYMTPGVVDRVQFENGRIVSIEQGPSPRRP